MFVRVAVHIPSHKTFSYAVPDHLEERIAVGKRVLAPFGKKRLTGYIVESTPTAAVEKPREIIDVLDSEPLFETEDLRFYQWVSDYYLYPLGLAITEILPGGINVQSRLWISPASKDDLSAAGDLSERQKAILETLKHFSEGLSGERLQKELGRKNIHGDVRLLEAKGLVILEDRMQKPVVARKKEKMVVLTAERPRDVRLTEHQRRVVDYLSETGCVPVRRVAEAFKNAAAVLKGLEKKGLLSFHHQDVFRLSGEGACVGAQRRNVVLNPEQEAALHEVTKGIASRRFSPYLLHGVTGSGKTEVYLQAIAEVLKGDGGVICLAPEIALTPQLFTRFTERFPDQDIALLHSGISEGVRYDQWRRMMQGGIRIVVGARSALFAPVRNLRLIIVDEEHDGSYKQDDRMRYNARDLAVVRAKQQGATVILGSATPSVQSFYNAGKRKYHQLNLPQRVENRSLPAVEIVDMKTEADEKGRTPILSRSLRLALGETLAAKKQALLFLNRRGFNTFLFCPDCGHVFQCLNCSVSMSHHAVEGKLKCHYCDLSMDIPKRCPVCPGNRVHSHGIGTERLEAEVKRLFPEARVARMDSDTTAPRGAHGRILRALDKGELDILVGTQMITKGHDFPDVTLVGVISADTALNMPDFRAAEKSFQVLTQVSGRSGRGDLPGRVVIQTFNPNHYAIRRAGSHDYEGFYQDELPIRQSLSYPPFSRLITMQISSLNREKGCAGVGRIAQFAKALCEGLPPTTAIEIIGPAEAPLAKIRGRHRWQLILKGTESRVLHDLAGDILASHREMGLDVKVDVDPMNFM